MKLNETTLNLVLKKITKNVKYHRKIKGLSQLSLALEMGHKSVGLISFVEAGLNNRRFNLEHLATISVILDVPIQQFFDGVDEILRRRQT